LTYEAFKVVQSFDFVTAQLQGFDLGERTQVGKLLTGQIVVCEHNLPELYGEKAAYTNESGAIWEIFEGV
jgi:hypothetical protein